MKTAKQKPKPYVCRKCTRTDFKTALAFTDHLRRCNVMVAPHPALLSEPAPEKPVKLREDLLRLRSLGIEVRDLADKLLKRVK